MSEPLTIATASSGLADPDCATQRELNFCFCSTSVASDEATKAVASIKALGTPVPELVRSKVGRDALTALLDTVDQRYFVQIADKCECLSELVFEHFFEPYLDSEELLVSRFRDYAVSCLHDHLQQMAVSDLNAVLEEAVEFSCDFLPRTDSPYNLFVGGFEHIGYRDVCGLTELAGHLDRHFGSREIRLFAGANGLNNALLRNSLVFHIKVQVQKSRVHSVHCLCDAGTTALDYAPGYFGRRGLAYQCRQGGLTDLKTPQSISRGHNGGTELARIVAEIALACSGPSASLVNEPNAEHAELLDRLRRNRIGAEPLPWDARRSRIDDLAGINTSLVAAMNRRLSSKDEWLANLRGEIPEEEWQHWTGRVASLPAVPSRFQRMRSVQ